MTWENYDKWRVDDDLGKTIHLSSDKFRKLCREQRIPYYLDHGNLYFDIKIAGPKIQAWRLTKSHQELMRGEGSKEVGQRRAVIYKALVTTLKSLPQKTQQGIMRQINAVLAKYPFPPITYAEASKFFSIVIPPSLPPSTPTPFTAVDAPYVTLSGSVASLATTILTDITLNEEERAAILQTVQDAVEKSGIEELNEDVKRLAINETNSQIQSSATISTAHKTLSQKAADALLAKL